MTLERIRPALERARKNPNPPHGGKRAGAGRKASSPSGPKEAISTRLDPVVVLRIERLAKAYGLSKAATLEKLVQEAHQRLYDEIPPERWPELGI
jgi:hypothetical protein